MPSHIPLPLLTAAVAGVVLVASTAPAGAGSSKATPPAASYEMPFPCGETWTGSTRAGHSPSVRAVDWNRNPDLGAPVVAAAPGTVVTAQATSRGGYGRWVAVDHGNGETSVYAHLASVTVAVGQRVDQGMMLGTLGDSGNARGAHLHFEQKAGRSVVAAWFGGVPWRAGALTSGNCVDVPLAGDFTGDRAAETAVFRRARRSKFVIAQGTIRVRFGKASDEPILGDWNGDGQLDVGVRSPRASVFKLRTPTGKVKIRFGMPSDQPVTGDWDGNGTTDVGVRRSADGTFLPRLPDGTASPVWLGDSDDLPVTGDWDGDGVTDLGVFDPATATFTLRTVDASGSSILDLRQFGAPGDLPVVGDWDGDGITDLGVWSPVSATLSQARSSTSTFGSRASADLAATVRLGRRR